MQAGTIIASKFQLLAQLGQGGMGAVWKAQHLALKAPVAIKLIDASIADAPEALARFNKEALAAASLRSPHVVQILDHGVDEASNTPYIAMELLDGESLADRLRTRGRLTPDQTLQLFVHVGRAISRAHDLGIVHRDLKPDNIFLVENDDDEVAKVLDFGIAKADHLLVPGASTRTGAIMGTAYYMSPEQIKGTSIDFRADIWSLGVIAHECLTGCLPFVAETIGALSIKICVDPVRPPSYHGKVPDGFDAWFARAVARTPKDRFDSVRELVAELRTVCASIGSVTTERGAGSQPHASETADRKAGPVTRPTADAVGEPASGATAKLPSGVGSNIARSGHTGHGAGVIAVDSEQAPQVSVVGELGVSTASPLSSTHHSPRNRRTGAWIVGAVVVGVVVVASAHWYTNQASEAAQQGGEAKAAPASVVAHDDARSEIPRPPVPPPPPPRHAVPEAFPPPATSASTAPRVRTSASAPPAKSLPPKGSQVPPRPPAKPKGPTQVQGAANKGTLEDMLKRRKY